MARGVAPYLVGSVVVLTLAGCGRSWLSFEEREPWRREAELTCLKSGAVKQNAAVTPIKAIEGPGICGADYPLKIAALGESSVLGYADELRPPAAIPQRGFPVPEPRQTSTMAARYPDPPESDGPISRPMSIRPPSGDIEEDDLDDADLPGAGPNGAPPSYPQRPPYGQPAQSYPPAQPRYQQPAHPYPSGQPQYETGRYPASEPQYRQPSAAEQPPYRAPAAPYPSARDAEPPPLGAPRGSAAATPAAVVPEATLACPLVSALDRWMADSVQPAAQRWFGQPVVEIKQISAYSCRGMNGQPGARISEHAFGNALDIAAFALADGRRVTVKDGWRGTPEEQGFLRDIQGAACQNFSTVLAPGSNVFHYDHIHVDLARRRSGRSVCNPAAVPGDLIAQRARERYATGHNGRMGYAPEAEHSAAFEAMLPRAIPGED